MVVESPLAATARKIVPDGDFHGITSSFGQDEYALIDGPELGKRLVGAKP
jgi:hypothetical protein